MTIRYAVIFMTFLPLGGCNSEEREPGQTMDREGQPPVSYVEGDSPEFSAAIEKARSTVGRFTAALANPKPAQSSFSVKLAVKNGELVEHMWILPVRHQNGKFVGTINNEPDRVATVKIGDEISVDDDKISDWMYVDNGRLVGGFTLRVLRKNMSKEEAYEFGHSVPFVIADESDPDDPLVQFFDSIGNAEHDVLSSLLASHPDYANCVGVVAVEGPLGDMGLESQHPLKYAAYHGNAKSVEVLLRHIADPDARDVFDATPLHRAARLGHADIVKLLAEHGADVNARNQIGVTPLKTAAGNDSVPCAKVLLELGADVGIRLRDTKDNVLHNIHSVEMAEALLAAGADLEATNDDGETPLHVAANNGFTELVVFLIEQGANTKATDNQGRTPIDIARDTLEENELARVLAAAQR